MNDERKAQRAQRWRDLALWFVVLMLFIGLSMLSQVIVQLERLCQGFGV